MNILLKEFKTPFETTPFGTFENTDFLLALEEGIEITKRNLEKIRNVEKPTFENICIASENSDKLLGRLTSIFFNLHSAEASEEIQKIAEEFSPRLTDFGNEVALDPILFSKLKQVYDKREELDLSKEEYALLENQYLSLIRNGALLNEGDKEKLKVIDKNLAKASLSYSDNALKETNSYVKIIENIELLKGLPQSAIDAAAAVATEKGEEGKWAITLDFPSYYPVLVHADNRSLREEIFIASSTKAFKNNEFNNTKNIFTIVNLRHERACLLGFETHSDFVLQRRMAEKPKKVFDFLEEIRNAAYPYAISERKELIGFVERLDGPKELKRWDIAYYSEKLKKEKFEIDDELLRPYFSLTKVIDGAFEVAKKLYGLQFTEINNIATYHEDVKTYEVKDSEGDHLAILYGDFFPRAGKRAGAWMTDFRGTFLDEKSREIRPHISIVCNFTKPTNHSPSLLTFREVQTLFHEFGHALHGMLAKGKFESLTGTNVFWDFVELPSQVLENWTFEKECLDLFAKHYETGEVIPKEFIEKIKKSANFQEGMASLRQVSLGLLDMGWHAKNPSSISDIEAFEQEISSSTSLFERVPKTATSPTFGHIFAGGYSSGYYSYKWAEVLDADAFELFKEKGIFSKEVADLFRVHILEKGGTEHPMNLYKNFRGKEPSVSALLKRGGLK